MRYYVNTYDNDKMREFMVAQEDLLEDGRGVYTEDSELYKVLQNEVDALEFLKSVKSFVEAFEIEQFIENLYTRVIEDDEGKIISLIYDNERGYFEDVIAIEFGDVFDM